MPAELAATTTQTTPAQTNETVASAPATTPATESYSGDNLQSYVLGQMQARTGVDALIASYGMVGIGWVWPTLFPIYQVSAIVGIIVIALGYAHHLAHLT